MIKYCDRCKWDELTQSKSIPDDVKPNDLIECPVCKSELNDVADYSQIP